MSYPEHDKLREVSEQSQALGEFLDFGLAKQDLALYEKIVVGCECGSCERGRGRLSPWHTDEEKATIVDGVVQVEEWVPVVKTIQRILAEHFGLDQAKLDAEKDAMLEALRAEPPPTPR